MLVSACLALLAAVLGCTYLTGYWIGSNRRLCEGDGYKPGYREGLRRHEVVRAALKREIEEIAADRDRLDAALDEMGRKHEQLLAERFVPLARRAVTVYDQEEDRL